MDRGSSEPDKDILFLETSTDGETWMRMDSLSGAILTWQRREAESSKE
jgi:hypothetical protein